MRKGYPSDIDREVFEKKVLPILRKARKRTKPITVDLYEVFCGVLYVLKSGCQWRMLPFDFPKWRTCYDYWQKWSAKSAAGSSLLEEALKKCSWRNSTRPWAGYPDNISHS
jgi:transposase